MTYPPGMPNQPYGYGPDGYGQDVATTRFNTERRKSRRRMTLVLSAIVAVLVVVVGLGAVKLYQDKTGNILIPALSLRAADDPGPDPFTDSVVLRNRIEPPNIAPRGASDRGVRSVSGTTPGLYGTTGSASCDTAALGTSLANDRAAGDAWASVFGIRRVDIPWYLNTLTPVVLTADTWVTNHAYRGGVPAPFQSVLQRGTAVYVDGAGVPRAVCTCGNPLLPPAAAPVGGYRVVGQPWPTYRTTNIERVSYTVNATTVNNTTVVNTPAPLTQLTVFDLLRGVNVVTQVGNTLADLGPAPAGMNLPDPMASNGPPSFTGQAAADNGLRDGSTEPVDAVVQRAQENGDTPALASPGTDGTTAADAPGGSTTMPTPTDFGSSTGDAIGSLTFTSDDQHVTCTLPSTFDGTEVAGDCSDGTARAFRAADLMSDAVRAAVNTSPDRVWTIDTTDGQSLTVTSAMWQNLVPVTTETSATTTETTAPTTTEEPTTTAAPTPEETTPQETQAMTPTMESESAVPSE